MRLETAALLVGLAVPVAGHSETSGCGDLVAVLEGLSGYELSSEPAPDADGACVASGVSLTRPGAPRVTVETLRLAGATGEGVQSVDMDLAGLRLVAGLNDREMDERLRGLFRLQSADLALTVRAEEETGLLVENARIGLSGGSELTFSADLPGAGLTLAEILSGRLTRLDLTWKNDGRVMRPAMEAVGQRLQPDVLGPAAVDVARKALRGIAEALPPGLTDDASDKALADLIEALPQGRGRMTLGFASDTGIGAAQLGLLALAEDPAGPDALARLFSGAQVTLDWQPGLGD